MKKRYQRQTNRKFWQIKRASIAPKSFVASFKMQPALRVGHRWESEKPVAMVNYYYFNFWTDLHV